MRAARFKKFKEDALATDGHGKRQKKMHLPRNDTELKPSMDPRIREDDKCAFARMTKANGEGWPRASEAKGPLPSGKRVGSREKKEKEERKKKKKKKK